MMIIVMISMMKATKTMTRNNLIERCCVYRIAALSKCRRCTKEHRSKRKHGELQMKGSIFVQVYM